MKAACVLILNEDGKVLTVSRKNDPNNIGLPGGKCDDGEPYELCAIRECYEETGFVVSVATDNVFVGIDGDFTVKTFLGTMVKGIPQGPVDESETGVVAFKDPIDLVDGDFGEYNSKMLKHFDVHVTQKYLIWYEGVKPSTVGIIDEIEAYSKTDAIKRFFSINRKHAPMLFVCKVDVIT